MTSDLDLLGQFAREKSQDAFTALVSRHVNLVYSAALRQVRSPQLAEEIAQSVFADLARNACSLAGGGDASSPKTLTPWLYAVTRRTAIDVIRKESRRQLREQIAVELTNMNATPDSGTGVPPVWTDIEVHLDDAMAALDETDRSAVLLRYFEHKNLREVGEALGASDDAAQKRVSRAVERLREFFSKRNVTIGAGGLAVVISANAVQAAPIGLTATISAAAFLAGTAVHTSTIIAATKTIAMTTLQKAVITAALTAAVGTGIFEAHQAAQLLAQNQILQQQQTTLTDQNRQLQSERDNATNRLAWLAEEVAQNKKDNLELLKLRAEVTRLHRDSQELAQLKLNAAKNGTELADKSWLDRVGRLRQRLEQTPEAKIPELQFLTEQDWLYAANHSLDTDDDYRAAFAELRQRGEGAFLELAQNALRKYFAENNEQFPTDFSKLEPYFEDPSMAKVLQQRYQIVPANNIPQANLEGKQGDWLITLKVQDSGSQWGLGRFGVSGTSSEDSDTMAILAPAMKAAMDAAPQINGSKSITMQQVLPYLTTPEQKAAYQKLMQRSNPAFK
jgi:RNA polymerase sigma factor (sigma-70 family)